MLTRFELSRLYSRVSGWPEFWQLSSVSVQAVATLLSLIRAVIVLRLLGVENYGLVGLASAAGGMFSILQHFGLGVGAAKEASQTTDARQLGVTIEVLMVVRFVLLLPLLVLLALVGAPLASITYQQPALSALIRLYALYLFVSAPGDILGYVLTGTERYGVYFALRIFNEVVMTVTMVWMILTLGVQGYFWGYVIAGSSYTLASGAVVWGAMGRRLVLPTRQEVWRLLYSVFKTSLAVYAAKLLRGFSGQVPVLIAGLFLSTRALGWLKFAQQAGGYLGGLVSPVLLVTLPCMVRLQAKQGTEALCHHFSGNFRRVAWGVSLLLMPSLLLSHEISWLIGGAEFSNAWQAVQLMLVFYGCTVLADNIFSGIHFPLDRERMYVLAYSGLFAISVVATAILTFTLKSTGSVALAMALGAVLLLGLAVWQVRDLPGLSMFLIRSTAPVALAIFLGLSSMFVGPLGWRAVLGGIGFSLIALDIWRSDQTMYRVARL